MPLFIGVFFAPESPWWLVRKGRIEAAKKNLLRLTSLNRETEFDADETIDMMRHTTELEQEITGGASYWACFKGTDLRRTEIVCMTWVSCRLWGGSSVLGIGSNKMACRHVVSYLDTLVSDILLGLPQPVPRS